MILCSAKSKADAWPYLNPASDGVGKGACAMRPLYVPGTYRKISCLFF